MNLASRLERLEKQSSPERWIPPIVEYDPDIPGEEERISAEVLAQAQAAGWTEGSGVYVILIPLNGRDLEEGDK